MSNPTPSRRFVVVGRPFYRQGEELHFDVDTISEGDLVIVTGKPDEDGDVTVRDADDLLSPGEPIAPDCLVEVDAGGYPIVDVDLDDEDGELLAALAPLAVVILLRGI